MIDNSGGELRETIHCNEAHAMSVVAFCVHSYAEARISKNGLANVYICFEKRSLLPEVCHRLELFNRAPEYRSV